MNTGTPEHRNTGTPEPTARGPRPTIVVARGKMWQPSSLGAEYLARAIAAAFAPDRTAGCSEAFEFAFTQMSRRAPWSRS